MVRVLITLEFASAIPDPTEESHALPEDDAIYRAVERLVETLDPCGWDHTLEAVRA